MAVLVTALMVVLAVLTVAAHLQLLLLLKPLLPPAWVLGRLLAAAERAEGRTQLQRPFPGGAGHHPVDLLVADLRPGLLAEFAKFKASPGYGRVLDEMLGREASNKTNLVHWMHLPVGFDVMREWMAQMRAAENLDFIGDVIKFKNLDDVAYTKENAARIHSKFIAEGSVAQICISVATFNQIHEGLSMRYPSHSLFDDAAEHITSFMQQDLWESFKASTAYQMASSGVHSSLSLNSNPPLHLSLRFATF